MCDSYVYAKPILSLSTTISYVNIFTLDIQTCYQIVLVICINLVHQSKKSFFSCCIFASLQLILICFKLGWYPLVCLGSRFLSKSDFCEITLLQPLFYPKKRFQIKFCKTVKITPLGRLHFDRPLNFFLHPRLLMVVFTVLGKFLVVILPRKKTSLWGKIFFFF